jgi:hypothetical protein
VNEESVQLYKSRLKNYEMKKQLIENNDEIFNKISSHEVFYENTADLMSDFLSN